MKQETYDPITLIHYMYWELRRLKGSPDDFQRMFEDVATRARDQFVRVRSYGNIGDRKCDGLYFGDDTVYQVYSPDEMKEAETRRKIERDLTGAIRHWGDKLKRWVFVYNVRRGLAPDIVIFLKEHREKYQSLKIETMSNDDLWNIARKLSAQERTEILGPPPGYESLFPLSATLVDEVRERLRKGRFVVIQDILSPINIDDAIQALRPAIPFAPPLFICVPSVEDSWQLAADHQKAIVGKVLSRSRERLPRFAVFSLAPTSLAIHLGFLLSDRVDVQSFQYDRDRMTWQWDDSKSTGDLNFTISGLPKSPNPDLIEAAIRVSLSARVTKGETVSVICDLPIEIDLRVSEPDVMWLVSADQLMELGRTFRRLLADLRHLAPNLKCIHLFYAGPTAGAVVIGQSINPRMNPPTMLYEYHRGREPRYQHVLTLE